MTNVGSWAAPADAGPRARLKMLGVTRELTDAGTAITLQLPLLRRTAIGRVASKLSKYGYGSLAPGTAGLQDLAGPKDQSASAAEVWPPRRSIRASGICWCPSHAECAASPPSPEPALKLRRKLAQRATANSLGAVPPSAALPRAKGSRRGRSDWPWA